MIAARLDSSRPVDLSRPSHSRNGVARVSSGLLESHLSHQTDHCTLRVYVGDQGDGIGDEVLSVRVDASGTVWVSLYDSALELVDGQGHALRVQQAPTDSNVRLVSGAVAEGYVEQALAGGSPVWAGLGCGLGCIDWTWVRRGHEPGNKTCSKHGRCYCNVVECEVPR